MPNGSLFESIKSRIGRVSDSSMGRVDDYDDYEDYDEYDEYDEYEEESVRDPYMERSSVTIRGESGVRRTSLSSATADSRVRPLQTASQRLNRDTSKSISLPSRNLGSRNSHERTMVDSSLPPNMTAQGTADMSAKANKRAGGLDALFEPQMPVGSANGGSGAKLSPSRQSTSSDIIRNSMQLSMPGQRRLQVIHPSSYENAEEVTKALKSGDVAILAFKGVDKQLMKRILDFAFGAASALDASVECIADGVFAICKSVGLDDREMAELRSMGVL